MKISCSSLGYKIISSIYHNEPTNLCEYIRKIIGAIAVWLAIAVISTWVLTSTIYVIGGGVFHLWPTYLHDKTWSILQYAFAFGGIVGIGALTVFSMLAFAYALDNYIEPALRKGIFYTLSIFPTKEKDRVYVYKPPKKPGVILQYLKDKHDKVCRMITFE